jgi:hypothetical protein
LALSTFCFERQVNEQYISDDSFVYSFVFRLLKRFYDFHRNKNNESIKFSSDKSDQPIEIELPLRETIYSCLFFTLTTISLLLTERGCSFYWKITLFGTPISLLWMHLFPSSRFIV